MIREWEDQDKGFDIESFLYIFGPINNNKEDSVQMVSLLTGFNNFKSAKNAFSNRPFDLKIFKTLVLFIGPYNLTLSGARQLITSNTNGEMLHG